MEDPHKKIYTPAHIGLGTFLGSLLLGAYMMAHNYKVFGQLRQARMVWIISISLFAILIGIGILAQPEHSTGIFSTLIVAGAYCVSQKLQGADLEKHAAEGGLPYKWEHVVILTLSAFAIQLTILLLALLPAIPV